MKWDDSVCCRPHGICITVSLCECVTTGLGGVCDGHAYGAFIFWDGLASHQTGVECKLGNVTRVYQTAPWKFVDALSFLLLEKSLRLSWLGPCLQLGYILSTLSAPCIFTFSRSPPFILGLESGGRQVVPFDNGEGT